MKTPQPMTRAKPKGANVQTHTPILAMDIATAAATVGLSRAQFYRLYLKPGRLRAIKTGGRDRVIDYEELVTAYKKLRDELPRVESLA
jgi:predicted DNA-binding transcriptional regulator AlpA